MVWGAPGAPPGPQDGENLKKGRTSEFAGRPQGAKLGPKIEGKSDLDDSLITGSSSIYKSLECAEYLYSLLNRDHSHLKKAKALLKDSIINKPDRYDRTWESKSRYSMDWYYPILCGVLDREMSIERVEKKWHEFIVEGVVPQSS